MSLRSRIRAEVDALEHNPAPTWVLFGFVAVRFVAVAVWLLLRRALGLKPGRVG